MDAFEQVVSEILWAQGYWVRRSFKVDLTKKEKARIGKPTAPRWEIDVVAYKPGKNELLAVECKSYLDSRGVTARSLLDPDSKAAKRYKLFCDEKVNKVVPGALRRELSKLGLCSETGATKLCLVCGRIASERDREELAQLFAKNNWQLMDKKWLRGGLESMRKAGYENEVSAVVAKLLLGTA